MTLTTDMLSTPQLALGSILSLLLVPVSVPGQTGVDDPHITPRTKMRSVLKDPAPPTNSFATTLKSRVDLVLVPVSVTDEMNRSVTGLEKDNFKIYENQRLQPISTCSSEDSPVSVGIILDTSGSMQNKLPQAEEAVIQFIANANPNDDFFLVTFSDTPVQISDFGASPDEIGNGLLGLVAKGRTALLDALYFAIAKMKNARYSKKAILIVSDGGDNHSRYNEHEVRALAKEADVMIYAIGIYQHLVDTEEERMGPMLLANLSEVTGGRTVVIESARDLADAAISIGSELRNLYVLAYRPENSARDGKWHRIKVKVLPPKGLPRLQVHHKDGYYGTSE